MSLRDYYLDLIIPEHQGKPKLRGLLNAVLVHSDDIYDVAVNIDDAYDIETASGQQLDVIAQLVGVNRQVVYDPYVGESSILDDYMLRLLIKSKVLQNHWGGGIEDNIERWNDVVKDYTLGIKDNGDMSIDLFLIGPTNPLLNSLVTHGYIIPKPAGVRVNYAVSEHPLFAYDMDSSTQKGYDLGWWSEDIMSKPLFSYEKDELKNRGYDQGYWR